MEILQVCTYYLALYMRISLRNRSIPNRSNNGSLSTNFPSRFRLLMYFQSSCCFIIYGVFLRTMKKQFRSLIDCGHTRKCVRVCMCLSSLRISFQYEGNMTGTLSVYMINESLKLVNRTLKHFNYSP